MAASYKKNLLKIAKSPDKTFKILSETLKNHKKITIYKRFSKFFVGF
jgi:hypothetical protein